MLTVSPEYFRSDEIAEVKNWLSQPGAALIRKALASDIAKLQIEASEKFYEGLKKGMNRRNEDGELILITMRERQNVLDYLNFAQTKDFKPFTAKIVAL